MVRLFFQSPPGYAVLALALLACGFRMSRYFPTHPAVCPLIPTNHESSAAPSPDTGLGEGGAICASQCDVSRAAERVWRGRDPAASPVLYRVRILRVVDGDTIRILWHGQDVGVRLLRIDTPERGQAGFQEATDHLRRLIGGDFIDLEFEGRAAEYDRHGRLLAYLRKDDRNLNIEMVRSGHAVFYDRYGAGKYRRLFINKE